MTWSIVALDATGALGVAVASRFFAVGALCPYVRAGVGAVSTQALVNPMYGPAILDAIQNGKAPSDALARVLRDDDGRDHRQVHVVNAHGHKAWHNGAACIDWCGQISRGTFSVAGNMLAGEPVLLATASAYEAASDQPFALRLIEALAAGERAGGDKRGKQAATVKICTSETYPTLDLRVDDHIDPIGELRRLHEASLERFQPFLECLPSRARPAGITDRGLIEAHIARFQAQRAGSAR